MREDSALPHVPEPLPRDFYARDVLTVARELVGKHLVHLAPDGASAGRIVEVEAYRGPEDRAAHSAGGRRTRRTEVMFGAPGHAYMFLLYGTSWAFNVVTGQEGQPHAVLVRALEPLPPLEPICRRRRDMPPTRRELTNGPGKLCAALGLDGALYGHDLCEPPLFIADAPGKPRIARSPRINIDYAGAWVNKPWRFYERGNRYVSVKPRE